MIFGIYLTACNGDKPSVSEKIITNKARINDGTAVQLQNELQKINDTNATNNWALKNAKSVYEYYTQNKYAPLWTNKGKPTALAETLKKFIDKDCKYFGLFPASYHQGQINQVYATFNGSEKKLNINTQECAKLDALMTDAFFQMAKHIKIGRLYNDTNHRYFDSNLHYKTLLPSLLQYINTQNLQTTMHALEPKFSDYDSLKMALKNVIDGTEIKYTRINYPYKDSMVFVKTLIARLQEEGILPTAKINVDSAEMHEAITTWQKAHQQNATGKIDKEVIDEMNIKSSGSFAQAALSMDKFKNKKINHTGNYVLVNIPSYLLRGYANDMAQVESKVAVGKLVTKTPIMESEISELILMPMWHVPPSILKIPGWLDRHRSNKNFTVRGKTAVQKSGPGNALGEMKFNFKSSDAVYLHDTNEKWAFGSSKRAVSHGCVRVQKYKQLADFISSVSPIFDKHYQKIVDKMTIDSTFGDTTIKYKYVVTDSIRLAGDSVITKLLTKKSHRELTVQNKVPVYIMYFTCAARNGKLITYPDVYGYDKALIDKYFNGM
jgi:L,D-transpeptidase YcbB